MIEDGMLTTTLTNHRLKMEGEVIFQRNGSKEFQTEKNGVTVYTDENGNVTRVFSKKVRQFGKKSASIRSSGKENERNGPRRNEVTKVGRY